MTARDSGEDWGQGGEGRRRSGRGEEGDIGWWVVGEGASKLSRWREAQARCEAKGPMGYYIIDLYQRSVR